MNHHREGSGPGLVLIHGVGHHWQGWRPVIERLAPDFDVVACDSPGFGRSAPLADGVRPGIVQYADAFQEFFEDLGLERPHVAGNSMGGAIALELARRGAVASATAFSPAGFWTAAERRFCQRSLGLLGAMPGVLQPAVKALARTGAGRVALFSQTFGYPARMPAEEAVGTLDSAWESPSLAAALEAFDDYVFAGGGELASVPVTVAWGRLDKLLIYRRQAPRAARAIPSAQHVTLDAGHVPYWDDPAACAAAIRECAGRVPKDPRKARARARAG